MKISSVYNVGKNGEDEYEMELIEMVNGEEGAVFYVYFDTYHYDKKTEEFFIYMNGKMVFYTSDEQFVADFLESYSDCE